MCRTTLAPDLRFRIGLTLLLVGIACFGALDLLLDRPERPGTGHVLFELGFVGLALASTVFLWAGWLRTSRALLRTRIDLAANAAERDQWRRRATKLLQGLGAEIDSQFDRWNLTPAEREVALFLLKGFGHKEAAVLMGRSERTTRQHAVAVYRKAGLAGRAELSAFFLEDLLLPARPAPESGSDRP